MATNMDALFRLLAALAQHPEGQQAMQWLQTALAPAQQPTLPAQWRPPLLQAAAPSWQPPEEEPQLSQVSLGVLPGAKPGYPGREIWQHAEGPGYSTHLNRIENFGGKDYIIPSIFGGRIVSPDEGRQIALQHNLIDPETGHPFPEETGIIAEGPYAGWGQVEKQWHDDLQQQAQQALYQTTNGLQYLQRYGAR